MSADFPAELQRRAAAVRFLLTDVDGCWTDGGVRMLAGGQELVCFHVHDGFGLKVLMRAGVEVGVVTGRDVPAVGERVRALGVEEFHAGVRDKAAVAARLVEARGLARDEVAAFGDDILDLGLFEHAGLRFAPANAVAAVQARADWVTGARGGHGALREVCERLAAGRTRIFDGER